MFQFVLHLHYDVLHLGMIGFAAGRMDFASHLLCYETKFFPFVFVVGLEGVLEARPVRADTLNGREWLVSEGLRDGDRVAVSHTMSLRPGMKVRSAAARPQPHAQQ